ncbi:MAG: HEAT repeat domain-containing protein [Sandaracinaceae bacterium]|nr:HEAT repeat domain-containing protein [Sandaracinaceae bacterium]
MRWTACALCALLLAACGAGPRARVAAAVGEGDLDAALAAYEELRRTEGSDAQVLAQLAALVLAGAAESDDASARDAALVQLSLAGTAGAPVLRRLADAPGDGPARLGALAVLARRGDVDAQLALRALADDDDPTVVALSVEGMDPALDGALLLRHIGAPDAALRRAAVARLAPASAERDVRELDEDSAVRAAAVRALRAAGAAVTDALRERLADPAPSVRFAAVGALAALDAEAADPALVALLEVAVSTVGIEAARLLAAHADLLVAARARALLERALEHADGSLRAQAGVALAGLSREAEAPLAAVRTALARERDADVRLALARALHHRGDPSGRAALEALLEEAPMPRAQAAALLAEGDHAAARAALAALVEDASAPSLVRRTAARALARDARRPDAVREALRDADPFVRIYAAGGILAAAAAG